MQMKIQIINGPNLNLLGTREPEKYGYTSFEDFLVTLRALYPDIVFDYFQSNIEGKLFKYNGKHPKFIENSNLTKIEDFRKHYGF